jgi:glycine/D-amino acid oxidase-like deaminating enzyme/nitrite reductase/ring-hydroxylating ferredoxin subunit
MESFWEEEIKKHQEFESVKNNIDVSVCIIGGGLTGLSTAYYLSKKVSVAVVEKDRICSHTSGKTTGKITSQHGLFYEYLINSENKEFAKKYLKANEKAIDNIENIIKESQGECDFEREDAYVFTMQETKVDQIKNEQASVDKIDKEKSEFVKQVLLPLEIAGAIKFRNQAKFHPVKYGYILANSIMNNNGRVFENSKVTDIKRENGKYIVSVNRNKIIADYVVIATRYPIVNVPGYHFLKMYQSTSYAVMADVKKELFNGMYISTEVPNISFRTVKDGERKLLLAVGFDYKTGKEDLKDGYQRLETVIRKMYPDAEILYKWSAEDCISLDKIPYIGEISVMKPNMYIATGFNKWGITSSNIAANIITDDILGNENEYKDIFKSTRLQPIKNRQEVGNMLKEVNKSLIASRFKITKNELKDIKIGEGKIVNINNTKVGVYKSQTGEVFKIRPYCAHLGCELYFNNIDKTWECPCHGSKFSYDGKLIEVPSNKDLKQ